jgi:hypothetical protein
MVAVLADLSGVDDIQFLASQQFKAKSRELAGLSAHGLVNRDQKEFSFKHESFKGDVGFAVVETKQIINKTNVQCSLQSYVVEFYPLLVAFEQNTRHCIHQLSRPVSLSSFAHLSPIQSRSTSWFNKARNRSKEVIPTVKMKL